MSRGLAAGAGAPPVDRPPPAVARRPEAEASSAPTVRDPHPRSQSRAGPERWLRLGLVTLCFGALAASAVLAPAPPGAAGGITLAGHRLPELCTLKATTGLPCPGCGLTRSWVSAVHGDLAASLGHHPLGWLVLLYALAQGTRHGAWLAAPGRREGVERVGSKLDRGVILLGVLLVAAWIPRLILIILEA